ncbi:MAG: septum formation protein Maf [Rhodocyclales bacterium GWA2_65_20]|nr:MAG: septum formation protein Maf [Rhodocyclales bacterium GWA2_65_20]
MPRLVVLASTSPFRRELLARLQIPFETAVPETDESALTGEAPAATAQRLAEAKARAVAQRYPDALIIGSDQVAASDGERFGKPGSRKNAIGQLHQMRGKEVVFHTGLCLLNSATGRAQVCCVDTHVGFRDLTNAEIESYLDKEDALNCAGSAKSEGLGISLLSYLRGDDPNALIGLPLIALCGMLRAEGVALP